MYEVHHYYHISSNTEPHYSLDTTAELSGESYLTNCAEFPTESTFVPHGRETLSSTLDKSPPLVNTSNKPSLQDHLY